MSRVIARPPSKSSSEIKSNACEASSCSMQSTSSEQSTTSCEICQWSPKTRIAWKIPNKPLWNTHPRVPMKLGGNSMASKNIASISHIEREELRRKGIKIPSKLFSPKYLSPTFIIELNKNPSSLKRVCFVNSIVILTKEEVKEVIDEEESGKETDEEVEEILKYEEEEENDEDGSFAYECEFMILEDTTSIIDRHLGEMAFGRPFIDEIGLVYNREEGTVMFKQDEEKITFKIPHTIEIFKQTRLMGLSTDSIHPSTYEENFGHGRTHYYQSLLSGDEYMQDEGDRRGIRHLIRLEKEMMRDKGEVT
ncbi:hypothetical protein Tco_0951303 [Tanacetum coccineum]|uniref:Uncharacterized protein n=1 Tax=Tanacetum coccineum TaxID=301880 RepID=A0ABQ5DVH4_9ASTR